MGVTQAPPNINEVDPNSVEFRSALDEAALLLAGTGLGVFSRHGHYEMTDTEVVFEAPNGDNELQLYPIAEHIASAKGLPSCWGVNPDGTVVVLRYADPLLHARTEFDVRSTRFQDMLASVAAGFAGAGLHERLEITISEQFLVRTGGQLALEKTDLADRTQRVSITDAPDEIMADDWSVAAQWAFAGGKPVVRGFCFKNSSVH
ncbi:MAG TPA: hypothetical protein VJM32_03515 [Candidatus Saccharimonadales bacterium]|nr:hypothetical protein [Candidatus Saccharimonadales bacterium]